MQTKVYPIYSESADITFIMQDLYSNNTLLSTEVIGFYYGSPDEQLTKQYTNDPIAAFC